VSGNNPNEGFIETFAAAFPPCMHIHETNVFIAVLFCVVVQHPHKFVTGGCIYLIAITIDFMVRCHDTFSMGTRCRGKAIRAGENFAGQAI
jgi:hypothetical protein